MTVEWDDLVLVGRIARAHGNQGRVIVDPETDFPEERFQPGSVLYLRHERGAEGGRVEPVRIVDVRFHRGRPILGLAGVQTMNAAEALAGVQLRIEPSALQRLPENTFYHHELIGCHVVTRAGDAVGRVAAIEGGTAGSRLVVEGPYGDVLIPLAADICVEIDTAARTIVVSPPEGLLDLNVTRSHRAL